MAKFTEVIVEPDPQPTQPAGDWVVRIGRGGKKVSHHRLKTSAVKRGRREGRKRSERGAKLIVKPKRGGGRGKIVARYGPARK